MDKQNKIIIGGLAVALVVGAFLAYKRPVQVTVEAPVSQISEGRPALGQGGPLDLLNYSATGASTTDTIYSRFGTATTAPFVVNTNGSNDGEVLIQLTSTTSASQRLTVALRTSNDGKVFYPINYSYAWGTANVATTTIPVLNTDTSYTFVGSAVGTTTFAFRFQPSGAYTMFVTQIGTSSDVTSGGYYRLVVGVK